MENKQEKTFFINKQMFFIFLFTYLGHEIRINIAISVKPSTSLELDYNH